MKRKPKSALLTAAAIAAVLTPGYAQEPAPPAQPRFDADGTVRVPPFALPPSELSSPEARAQQAMRARMPVPQAISIEPDIALRRQQLNAAMAPRVARMLALYPVDVSDAVIGGVGTKVFVPRDTPPAKDKVLINLHGGAFSLCWDACAQIESIPVAALGGYKVVSVNYRMAPEHRHPAGVEDVLAVYRALLQSYRPEDIGLFGCSAGGALTAQAAALFPLRGLPQPGAIGIFGAGAVRFMAGDSAFVAGYIDGSFPPPPSDGSAKPDMSRGYFDGTAADDPVVSPALHPDVIGKFPPTLVITGTRAMDMSPAIVTNSALLRAGVRSTLIVGEGMGHCYMYQPDLPESRDAYAATVAHFREYLGRRR